MQNKVKTANVLNNCLWILNKVKKIKQHQQQQQQPKLTNSNKRLDINNFGSYGLFC